MKVIFIEDVRKQGKKGEIKEVSDGYAKNFLIKNKLAVMYTQGSVNKLNTENKEKAEKEKELVKEAEATKEKLLKENLVFEVPTGKEGKIFGSVSSKQIHEKLVKLGYNIDKKKIKVNSEMFLGGNNITIELHKNVICELKITLKSK